MAVVLVTGTSTGKPLTLAWIVALAETLVLGANSDCSYRVPAILNEFASDPAALLEAEAPLPSLLDCERIVAAVTNPFRRLRLLTVELLSAWAEL